MRSIIPNNGKNKCYLCGRFSLWTEEHHIFGGSRRTASEKRGLKVYLDVQCHKGTNGVHGKNGAKYQQRLHEVGQKIYEEMYGTREDFIKEFGKSYL